MFETNKERAVWMILLIVILGGFEAWPILGLAGGYFTNERNGYNFYLSDMKRSMIDGQTAHLLSFGVLSPNYGVQWSFATQQIVEVRLAASDGTILYSQVRNGVFSSTVYPDRASNITLQVIETCSPCSFTAYDGGDYRFYSRAPFFEFEVAYVFAWGTASIVVLCEYFREKLPVKGMTALTIRIAPAICSICIAWYVFAMGIYDGTWVGVLVAGGLYGAVVVRELYKVHGETYPDIVLDEPNAINMGRVPWGNISYGGQRIHFFNRGEEPGRLFGVAMSIAPKLPEYLIMSAGFQIGGRPNFPVKIKSKDYFVLPVDLDFQADTSKARPTPFKTKLVVSYEVQAKTGREHRHSEMELDFS